MVWVYIRLVLHFNLLVVKHFCSTWKVALIKKKYTAARSALTCKNISEILLLCRGKSEKNHKIAKENFKIKEIYERTHLCTQVFSFQFLSSTYTAISQDNHSTNAIPIIANIMWATFSLIIFERESLKRLGPLEIITEINFISFLLHAELYMRFRGRMVGPSAAQLIASVEYLFSVFFKR